MNKKTALITSSFIPTFQSNYVFLLPQIQEGKKCIKAQEEEKDRKTIAVQHENPFQVLVNRVQGRGDDQQLVDEARDRC